MNCFCKTGNVRVPLFREFRDLSKFMKMTGREYIQHSVSNTVLLLVVQQAKTLKGAKIFS